MTIIPLLEEQTQEWEQDLPNLTPTADLLTALKKVKKTLLVWDTQPGKPHIGDLIEYINEAIKMNGTIMPEASVDIIA